MSTRTGKLSWKHQVRGLAIIESLLVLINFVKQSSFMLMLLEQLYQPQNRTPLHSL